MRARRCDPVTLGGTPDRKSANRVQFFWLTIGFEHSPKAIDKPHVAESLLPWASARSTPRSSRRRKKAHPGGAPGAIQRIGFHSLLNGRPRIATKTRFTSHVAINCGWPT
jgi:hypothetical protein